MTIPIIIRYCHWLLFGFFWNPCCFLNCQCYGTPISITSTYTVRAIYFTADNRNYYSDILGLFSLILLYLVSFPEVQHTYWSIVPKSVPYHQNYQIHTSMSLTLHMDNEVLTLQEVCPMSAFSLKVESCAAWDITIVGICSFFTLLPSDMSQIMKYYVSPKCW